MSSEVVDQTIDDVVKLMNKFINNLGIKFTKEVQAKCQDFVNDVCDVIEDAFDGIESEDEQQIPETKQTNVVDYEAKYNELLEENSKLKEQLMSKQLSNSANSNAKNNSSILKRCFDYL